MPEWDQIVPVAVVVAIIALFLFLAWAVPLRLWIAAIAARVPVSLLSLIGMRLRRVNPRAIIEPLIMAHKAGLHLTTSMLEAHYLANGHVDLVVLALISADKAKIPLTWERATAIDLAGRDVFDAVQRSVLPKVIDCPDPAKGPSTVAAVAKDGIQLKAKARVTVRSNLDRLIGGATEDTIIARVGEGIVTTIGSAETHKQVLENPDLISKRVLQKGLDAGTAFEILSIDIADVDVGENIGAKLQIDQAQADKQIAQARAERRAAEARAIEQENLAKVQEMRARLVEAEAEVPRAIAEAFRSGRLGIMDYYMLRNIQADTQMRQSIAGEPESPTRPKGVV
ncbi:MAG: flotillin-like protein FloA [Candidatus Sumerlaeia bacterium]|nr:flotillin-like protein FloA [Candidatus Sumerlaeia bacterium]